MYLINPTFSYYASFLIVPLTPSTNEPDFSRHLTIFIISSISLFETINTLIPNPRIFLRIPTSTADPAANPDSIKTPLANDLNTFLIKDKAEKTRNHPESLHLGNPLPDLPRHYQTAPVHEGFHEQP